MKKSNVSVVNEAEMQHRKLWEEDEIEHGCGYWSVCLEHDCPCSPGAPVTRGFNEDVWEGLARAKASELEVYCSEDDSSSDEDYWPDEDDLPWEECEDET